MYPDLALYIDGTWTSGTSGHTEDVLDPATEVVIGALPHAGLDDLNAAVASATRGFALWRKTPMAERAAVLTRAADLIADRASNLAAIMTLEQGKTLAESAGEWARVVDTLRWHAGAVDALAETIHPARSPHLVQKSVPVPVGVALALTAWNFPAILPVRKLAPALMAGCSIILKASEETPASAIELVRALADAGLPAGVVNLVFGVPAEISSTLLARPEVRKLSFTGSVPVGKLLARQAADTLTPCTLELGGHAPAIITADADIETAAKTLAGFKTRNAGQVCIAPSRFFIERPAYKAFIETFQAAFESQVIGAGSDAATTMGPMANARRIEAMEGFVADAVGRGATVATGGNRFGNQGFFFAPTILENVPADAQIMTDEPFGPVAPLQPFDDLDAVIETANSLPYGLAAYAFTGSGTTRDMLIDRLESGGVAVNTVSPAQPETPFGGVKESGLGYEGGLEGILAYTHKKLVSPPPV